jgi:hypothetical protein
MLSNTVLHKYVERTARYYAGDLLDGLQVITYEDGRVMVLFRTSRSSKSTTIATILIRPGADRIGVPGVRFHASGMMHTASAAHSWVRVTQRAADAIESIVGALDAANELIDMLSADDEIDELDDDDEFVGVTVAD